MINKYYCQIGLLLLVTITACRSKDKFEESRLIGQYLVKAKFNDDSLIDGLAKFYSADGHLVSIVNYANGIQNGPALNYDIKGRKVDSFYFINGVKTGYQFSYDDSEQIQSMRYEYYGLKMGPEIVFKNTTITKFYFTDFDKQDLIDCKYDERGTISELSLFRTKPSVAKVIANGKELLEFYCYLPNPPGAIIEFNIGITNGDKNKPLFRIDSNRIYLDTLLPYPEKDWFYYVSAQIRNSSKSINKFFIEEVRHGHPSQHVVTIEDN